MTLDGKTAIVTGGAAGIGRAIADRFLREGARVLVADVDAEKGKRTEAELSGLGSVHFIKTDVGRRLDIHNLVAAAIDDFGDIDVLVNNAATTHHADFLDLKEDDLDRVLRINLKGPLLAGQAVARYMVDKVKAGGAPGSIINLSLVGRSIAAMTAEPASLVAHGGIAQLTRVMASSLAPWGIRVNGIGPGSSRDGGVQEEPAEVASLATLLASAASGAMTGETIAVGSDLAALRMSSTGSRA
ncbi:MAG: SDR family oxidoreductase [Rhizobiaceae bacterium]|nr:SDR family oxidoreductase [Rhizobiaceae bacterium]